jgi:hypothetical protein
MITLTRVLLYSPDNRKTHAHVSDCISSLVVWEFIPKSHQLLKKLSNPNLLGFVHHILTSCEECFFTLTAIRLSGLSTNVRVCKDHLLSGSFDHQCIPNLLGFVHHILTSCKECFFTLTAIRLSGLSTNVRVCKDHLLSGSFDHQCFTYM